MRSPSPASTLATALFGASFLFVAACASTKAGGGQTAPSVATVDVASSSSAAAIAPPKATESQPSAGPVGVVGVNDGGPLPVTAADPVSGNKDALVTLVVFADFQCPFCARASTTLGELRRKYTDSDLRFVWKNQPLPFHTRALPAAEAAQAVFEARGSDAFWRYHDALFADQRALEDADLERVASDVGVPPTELARLLARGSAGEKVRADMALAKTVDVNGTPSFFANGTLLSGAQPIDRFVELVDKELTKARAALAQGVRRDALYATMARQNLTIAAEEKRRAAAPKPTAPEVTVPQVVPIAGAPVRGPATALVTIVAFSDFQCPFCARSQATLEDVDKRFAGKVRFVWKNQPLAFHQRAEPMAEVAMEAFAQRGHAGFWKMHDALWKAGAASAQTTDAELVNLAVKNGFSGPKMRAAITNKKHAVAIKNDSDLGNRLGAKGTPTFFINGRKLVGAQPFEQFETIINEELARAEALVARGTPRHLVYDELQKSAQPAPP